MLLSVTHSAHLLRMTIITSETSRELFVHRNTLVYRLEKVKTKTGLDLRKFDDAVLFKMATMVRTYIDYLNDTNDNKIR